MRREGSGDAAIVVAIAAPLQRAGLNLGRQMAFLQRQQASGMKDDVGIGDASIRAGSRGSVGQFSTPEAAEQRTAGVMFRLPFRRAHPAIPGPGLAVYA